MATLIELDGIAPTIGEDVYLAPTATLIGDVHIGDRSSVWFGAVLRADAAPIEIGIETAVQDNVVLHCAEGHPTIIGNRVTIGHGAMLEGCVVEDGVLIGMGAIVLHHVRVGAGAMLAAGTVASERQTIRPGVLAAGVPAVEKKPLTGAAAHWTSFSADDYVMRRGQYLSSSRIVPAVELAGSHSNTDD
jgi:carbonic anhydrase/acetyltransferase-like protein (isoleucine patch superfamily)